MRLALRAGGSATTRPPGLHVEAGEPYRQLFASLRMSESQGAKVIGGPAPRPVPMVQLQFDAATGDISVVGMAPPTIFGHGPPGTTDPTQVMQCDLQGGDLVTQSTVMG